MKKRRIKKLIALILGIIIIIAVAVTLSLTVFFRIDNVAVTGDRFKLRTEAYYTVKIAEFIFAVRETFNFKSAEASVPDKSVTCHNGRYLYTQSFKFVKYFIGAVSGSVANYRQVGVF